MLQHLQTETCHSPLFAASMVVCLQRLAFELQKEFVGCCLWRCRSKDQLMFPFRHACNVHLCLLGTPWCNSASGILGFPLGFDDFIRGGVALKKAMVVISWPTASRMETHMETWRTEFLFQKMHTKSGCCIPWALRVACAITGDVAASRYSKDTRLPVTMHHRWKLPHRSSGQI